MINTHLQRYETQLGRAVSKCPISTQAMITCTPQSILIISSTDYPSPHQSEMIPSSVPVTLDPIITARTPSQANHSHYAVATIEKLRDSMGISNGRTMQIASCVHIKWGKNRPCFLKDLLLPSCLTTCIGEILPPSIPNLNVCTKEITLRLELALMKMPHTLD